MQDQQVRPTKKQRALLEFIREFIVQHGYGPSYREIMNGCNYSSVATVAVHIRNLIDRGHLRKNGRSARSLEITGEPIATNPGLKTNFIKPDQEKWLVEKIDYLFQQAEENSALTSAQIEDLGVVIHSLKVLGLEGASLSFAPRLAELKKKVV